MSAPSADDFAKLVQQVADLTKLITMQAQAASPSNTALVATQVPAPTSNSELVLGPLTLNPAASMSPSLFSLFPKVEVATITSIIQHDLCASDIYKLDTLHHNKAERKTLELNDTKLELSNDNAVLKEYKTLNSIIDPLSTYFSILIMHA
ncbi:hypothetical protein ARMGADRAFT_1087446 [Armillaria gallica]|uniref:Uncharacterized protein n=1 Tax=Armillaria gallica TaxID=47427 RepID=A0A2H3CRA2_ARMGA|nr:hypothetical protein ARMGADRAFT_1087446 [Armillaria gallica]